MNEPATLRAGTTWTWSETAPDLYPNATYQLKYYFQGPVVFNVTAANDGANFKVTITSATSKTYPSGIYRWVRQFVKISDATVYSETPEQSGELNVLQDLSTVQGGYDSRSHVRRVVEALEAVIENRATKAQSEIEIAGRRIWYLSPAELRKEWEQYSYLLKQEERAALIAQGKSPGNQILVRFQPIS
jgi:hypothetical protein